MDQTQIDEMAKLAAAVEKAVAGVENADLKVIAYQVMLGQLIGNVSNSPTTRGARAHPAKASGGQRPRKGGPTRHLAELLEEGFFDEQRNLSQTVEELRARGHLYRQSDISPVLARMVRAKQLRRLKVKNATGKDVWVYQRWRS